VKIRVYYEDTDTGGIVYHTNFINFCERARSEVFFSRGLTPDFGDSGFVAKKIEADFVKPARLGDLLEVKTSLKQIKSASFSLTQTIYKDENMVFKMDITLAYVGSDGRPKRLGEIKDLILSLFDD
jgi:acyl-CoA thioester hydrolase